MTIRLSWPSQASKIQRINYLSPTTKGRYYPIFEEDRVLHRGIFNNAGGTPVSTLGTLAQYFGGGVLCMEHDTALTGQQSVILIWDRVLGGGVLCMEHDTAEDRVLHRGATIGYTYLGQGTLGTLAQYFNDLLYTMVNEVPKKQRWANWADYNGKTHDEIASLTNPCEYIMRLPRGLTTSSESPAYPFVHGTLPATPQDAKIVHRGDT
ncbi:hypothetical protein SPFM1_00141 [Salmonella phage SPFM1]|nr:hypothetical protein SPFM1_00141 [Salmonella phage SPFM1]